MSEEQRLYNKLMELRNALEMVDGYIRKANQQNKSDLLSNALNIVADVRQSLTKEIYRLDDSINDDYESRFTDDDSGRL